MRGVADPGPAVLLAVGAVSKAFLAVVRDENLWRMHCLALTPSFHDFAELMEVKSIIQCPSFRCFHRIFRKTHLPLLGMFRVIPNCYEAGDCSGGILWIAKGERLQVQFNGCSWEVLYSPECHQLEMEAIEAADGLVKLDITQDGINFSDGSEFQVQLCPFPAPFPAMDEQQPLVRLLRDSLGIYSASYGPHGPELLYMHITMDEGLQLRGLKVTGDENVPAGQLSFVIDLLDVHPLDGEEEAQFLHYFDEDDGEIISISERLPSIKLWANGRGQVNMEPFTWAPQWENCSLIFYDPPVGNGVRYSIIWEDGWEDGVREGFEFTKWVKPPEEDS